MIQSTMAMLESRIICTTLVLKIPLDMMNWVKWGKIFTLIMPPFLSLKCSVFSAQKSWSFCFFHAFPKKEYSASSHVLWLVHSYADEWTNFGKEMEKCIQCYKPNSPSNARLSLDLAYIPLPTHPLSWPSKFWLLRNVTSPPYSL